MLNSNRSNLLSTVLKQEGLESLRSVVKLFYGEGLNEKEVLQILEEYLQKLKQKKNETDEDRIREVMDFVAGFCSPI